MKSAASIVPKVGDKQVEKEERVWTKTDLLLAPQRAIKQLLKENGTSSFMGLIKASPDELRQTKAKEEEEPKEEEIEEKTTIKKYISNFEIFIVTRAVYINNDDIFRTFCLCIGVSEMRSFSLLNKRCFKRLYNYTGNVSLTIPQLTRFLTSCMALDKAGFIAGKKVVVDKSETAHSIADVHDIDILAKYFTCSKGDFTMKELSLQLSAKVSEYAIQTLLTSLQKKTADGMRKLSLDSCSLGIDAILTLSGLVGAGYFANMRALNLNRNNATEVPMQKLIKVLCQNTCPKLDTFYMGGNMSPVATITFLDISVMKKLPLLRHFAGNDNSIDLMGNPDVSKLVAKGTLTFAGLLSLNLSSNRLTDDGLEKVFRVAWPISKFRAGGAMQKYQSQLQSLLLDFCDLGNRSAVYISTLMKNGQFPYLKTLSMIGNEVQADGADSILRSLRECPSLLNLYLSLNNLGNEGVLSVLATAIGGALRSLRSLDVADVGASSDTCNQLVRTLSSLDQTVRLDELRLLRVYGKVYPPAVRTMVAETFARRTKIE